MVSEPKIILVGCANRRFAEDTLKELLADYDYELVVFQSIRDALGYKDVPWIYFNLSFGTYHHMVAKFGYPSTIQTVKDYLNGNKDWASKRRAASPTGQDSKDQ